jgi:ATP-dependent Clp protease ATP-binding subunit ClpA
VFDLCDHDTRTVIDTALGEAKGLGHSWLGTEHVLLALTVHRDQLPPAVEQLLPTIDQVRQALNAAIDPGPALPDAELLGTLGIDLDEVRAAVRQTFGADALDRLARQRVHQPWQPWRRPNRACISLLAGSQSVAPRLKRAFENATHAADRDEDQLISPVVLLLGVLEVQDALANRLLDDLGVIPSGLRAAAEQAAF